MFFCVLFKITKKGYSFGEFCGIIVRYSLGFRASPKTEYVSVVKWICEPRFTCEIKDFG